MQEHQHIKTTPGEAAAPEIVPHAMHPEAGGHTQSEDINIPAVALTVAFFAAFLLVVIIGLQAWFYNQDTAEIAAKQLPQGAAGTPLGEELTQYHHDLYDPPGWNDRIAGGEAKKIRRVPIDAAMEATVKRYASRPE